MHRRDLLKSAGVVGLASTSTSPSKADELSGALPWLPDAGTPPVAASAPGWLFFHPDEAAMVEAIADRIIPADELSIGGKEAGCAQFIDRQLAGDFGKGTVLHRIGPAKPGTPQQGPQYLQSPAERYRMGLAALAKYCGANRFIDRPPAEQDSILQQMEAGTLKLEGIDGLGVFNLFVQSVREGFFADPIYGGNKGMAGWKMLGFPGARYDYRPYIARRGEQLNLAPISLIS